MPWLQTIDSLAVNGPHAVVIAPVVTRIEMLRIARTYELCITRHRPSQWKPGTVPNFVPKNCFAARMGILLWNSGAKTRISAAVSGRSSSHVPARRSNCPAGFGDAVKAVTSGVTCLNCSHPHYSRLVVQVTRQEGTDEVIAARSDVTNSEGEWKQAPERLDGFPTDSAPAVQ